MYMQLLATPPLTCTQLSLYEELCVAMGGLGGRTPG